MFFHNYLLYVASMLLANCYLSSADITGSEIVNYTWTSYRMFECDYWKCEDYCSNYGNVGKCETHRIDNATSVSVVSYCLCSNYRDYSPMWMMYKSGNTEIATCNEPLCTRYCTKIVFETTGILGICRYRLLVSDRTFKNDTAGCASECRCLGPAEQNIPSNFEDLDGFCTALRDVLECDRQMCISACKGSGTCRWNYGPFAEVRSFMSWCQCAQMQNLQAVGIFGENEMVKCDIRLCRLYCKEEFKAKTGNCVPTIRLVEGVKVCAIECNCEDKPYAQLSRYQTAGCKAN